MSYVDVAAIREALSKATEWPWDNDDETSVGHGDKWVFYSAQKGDQGIRDAELIVLLRNNAEALLDRLERAEQIAHECWRDCHPEAVEFRAESLRAEAGA